MPTTRGNNFAREALAGLAGGLVALLGAGLLGAGGDRPLVLEAEVLRARTVRAQRLVVEDRAGRTLAIVGLPHDAGPADAAGHPALLLLWPDGKPAVSLSVLDGETAGLVVFDREGKPLETVPR